MDMIENIRVGDVLDFQYVEKLPFDPEFPRETKYVMKTYSGTVTNVRDMRADPVQYETVYKHPHVERSRFLFTIRTDDRQIKCFYDGRMCHVNNCGPELNLEPVETPVKKSFLKRILCLG